MADGESGVNTVLIVILLVIVVGFGVWWFTSHRNATPANGVDIHLGATATPY